MHFHSDNSYIPPYAQSVGLLSVISFTLESALILVGCLLDDDPPTIYRLILRTLCMQDMMRPSDELHHSNLTFRRPSARKRILGAADRLHRPVQHTDSDFSSTSREWEIFCFFHCELLLPIPNDLSVSATVASVQLKLSCLHLTSS
jgi:hypothetical protein